MAFAVIRVRGQADVRHEISRTMELLNLTRVNHCVIVPEDDVTIGMLQKSKDYITWGEVSPETVAEMIRSRGRLAGDKEIDDVFLKESGYSSVEEMASALAEGKAKMNRLGAKPVFRLAPPVKGYEGIKRAYRSGGALGYRGEAINDLIMRML